MTPEGIYGKIRPNLKMLPGASMRACMGMNEGIRASMEPICIQTIPRAKIVYCGRRAIGRANVGKSGVDDDTIFSFRSWFTVLMGLSFATGGLFLSGAARADEKLAKSVSKSSAQTKSAAKA